MNELTPVNFPNLTANRIRGLSLDETTIHPNYHGGSIFNLPASICRALGTAPLSAEPVSAELFITDAPDVRRIILVLVDALSLHRLQRWMSDGTAPVWKSLVEQGRLAALTSVVPSTTATALTTLWTGKSPAEHGIVGYELWLKEFGVVSDMIQHKPIAFENDNGSLAKAGFRPEQFLNLPTLGTHLASHGVKSYALQHRSIIRSGLSQMFFKDVDVHGYLTPSELWVNLRHLVEARPTERQYFWVYTGQIDHLSHYYHPDDERTAAEFGDFSRAFEENFLERLSPSNRRSTLIVLTADHGMIATRPTARYDLRNHPGLRDLLHILPTGESRLMYLFTRPGAAKGIRSYFDEHWPEQFTFINPQEAVEKGLFGPGKPNPRLADRMGDMIVVARQEAYLWWPDKENILVGRHGGLSADEMIVPLISVVL